MIAAAAVFITVAIITDGQTARGMMNPEPRDVFMDHFNSIVMSSDHPYTKFHVIYPPFITAVYALLGHYTLPYVVAEPGAVFSLALRGSVMGAMTFILIVIATLYLLHIAIRRIIADRLTAVRIELTFIMILTSFPVIYALERGNCIIMTVVLCLFFLIWYRSESKYARYASYIALGAAAGMKLYPAIFAVLLIRERRWGDTAICLAIGVLMFIVPLLFTDGSISTFIENALSYSNSSAYGGGRITINEWIINIIGRENSIGPAVSLLVQGVIALASVVIAIFDKGMKDWKVITLLSCNLILVAGIGTGYILIYAIIPTLFFVLKEREITKENIFFLVCFTIILCLIPGTGSAWQLIPTIKSFFAIMMLAYLLVEGTKRVLAEQFSGINVPNETDM